MKAKNKLLKIVSVFTAFAIGASVISFSGAKPTQVVAEQHLDNYVSYTYNGHYYDTFDFDDEGGMNGDLRTSLTSLIRPDDFYIYGSSGANHLSTVLQSADEDPTNSNNMIYFYTRDSVSKNAASTWNREHVWCQSLSGPDDNHKNWGDTEGGTDILHLRPTYNSTNSSRGNTPYGDISKSNPKYFDVDTLSVTNNSSKMLFGYCNGTYFEPLDAVKGDVARIIMYMWTTYTGWVGSKTYDTLNILRIIESYNTLLKWHTQDRPDALEGHRNDYAESSIQGNRNPFVDHPELAWRIFGDQVSNEIKNACMQAYPYNVEQVEPTGITLNRNSASIETGNTLQLSATLVPNNATGSITWTSSNTGVATVSNSGLVTGVSEGNTVITARVSQNIYATCSITVTQSEYIKVASYDFSVGNTSSVDEYSSASALKTRFSDSDVTGNGLSDIVLSVSNNSKVYAGYSGFYTYGLKLGTSSYNGTFTLGLSREISKVVVHTAGWGASDSLQVGDAAAQTPGVAYSGNNAIKELTYIITASDSVTFTYAKRGFIQSIDFYAASGAVSPATYLNNASSYAKLTANEIVTPGDSVTISKTIAQLVGTPAPSNGTQYVEFELDTVITVSVNKNGNNGKIYNSGTEWRLYQSDAAVMTVSASNGATISSITVTFGTANDGLLKYNDNAITSGSPVAISSLSSASFTVAKSTSGANGQIKVTAISVTYGEKGSVSVDTVAMIFGTNIPTNVWSAVNNLEDSEITDYGVMAFRTTEANLPQVSTVEQYFSSDPSNVSIIRKNSAVTPEEINGAYDFSVRIRFNGTSYYNVIYCVAPFIMVNEQYYFLPELRYSVNSLATYYKTHDGCDLSSDALDYLATTH